LFSFCPGLLGTFPLEIREIIYEYALSAYCPDARSCGCTGRIYRDASGLGLLRASGRVYNEAIPFLYASDLFGITCGFKRDHFGENEDEFNVSWIQPSLYRYGCLDRLDLTHVPHNALHLIRNLEIDFVNETLLYEDEDIWDFVSCTERYLHTITQVCTTLKDCVQLQYLDISLSFACKLDDIDYMASLVEPIKLLRGIKDPNVTVLGYQYGRDLDFNETIGPEPRWHLTSEFKHYLEQLLVSPHGTPSPPIDGPEVFLDSYEASEVDPRELVLEETNPKEPEDAFVDDDAELMSNYLRDVYGTDDQEALHGGLPVRWQIWLHSEVRNLSGLQKPKG
jgi:hypothetical protein